MLDRGLAIAGLLHFQLVDRYIRQPRSASAWGHESREFHGRAHRELEGHMNCIVFLRRREARLDLTDIFRPACFHLMTLEC